MTEVRHIKVLKRRDIILFSVSAILLLDTVAAGAAIGVSSLTWWVLLGLLFFIPFSMISAELGCAFPDQGGIYAWVKRAFGERWAARITWSYWVNVAVWAPSIFILFSGVFAQMFWPDMSMTAQIALGLALTWLTVFVNVITLELGKWVPNMGAIIKMIVFLAVIYGAFGYYQENGFANEITLQSLTPNIGQGVTYIPVIIYGMLGFELVSAGAEEMKNPARDVPQSIYVSAVIIFGLYFLATLAVLVAIPVNEIDLVEGLLDTLAVFFGQTASGQLFILLLGVGTLYTFFSNGVTWALGCNRAMAEAALEGEMPAQLGIMHQKRGTPLGAAIALGLVSSVILLLYGFLAENNEDLFWSLFAFSGVIFMIPYVAMMFAFIKLRKCEPNIDRPFRVKGPDWLVYGMACLCALILLATIILFIYVPGEGVQQAVLWGSIFLLLLGEVAIMVAHRKRQKQS